MADGQYSGKRNDKDDINENTGGQSSVDPEGGNITPSKQGPSSGSKKSPLEKAQDIGIPLVGMVKQFRRMNLRSDNKTDNSNNRNHSIDKMTTSGGSWSIRKFYGKNFSVWKCQVEAYLQMKDCDDVLTNPRTRDEVAARAFDERSKMARAIILLSLSDEQAIIVRHLSNAKGYPISTGATVQGCY